MRLLDIQAAIGTAILLWSLPCDAKHGHGLSHLEVLGRRHANKRVQASPHAEVDNGDRDLKKRSTCQFPTNAGLVAVTPGSMNAGWAMSPDQQCVPDSFCPFACPSGQVMAQWNPQAKNYPDPKSMDGGLYCNLAGEISKPFPDLPYCVDGTGALGAQNTCGKTVSFCQTVLPGNEAMIIPTRVDSWAQLAVPGPSYWLGTSAHYYVNFPGITTDEACIWGDGTDPKGNWAPFVSGGKTDADGRSWTMIGWNPIFLGSHHASTPPTFGVKIVCSGGDCPGTPCSIDPSSDGVGGVTSGQQATGAGGANFCVVTVPPGVTANVVIFNSGDSSAGSGDKPSSAGESSTESDSESTSTSTPEATTSEQPTTTAKATTTKKAMSKPTPTITDLEASTTKSSSSAAYSPHILFESNNKTSSSTVQFTPTSAVLSPTAAAPTESATKKSEAAAVSGSMFSFLVVFVAAAYML